MRRRKQKNVRRILRFLKIHYEFRPPYKVLVDGNFIHAWEGLRRGDINDHMKRLLGDECRIFTTKCVMEELRSLGKDYSPSWKVCRQQALHKCGHEHECVQAAKCLEDQVVDGNRDHFFVATQDKTLQKKLGKLRGCAMVFASVNGLHLEAPSDVQIHEVKAKEQKVLGLSKVDYRNKTLLELKQEEEARRPRERSIFKKKRAKGPNPLSMLPKKKKGSSAGHENKQNSTTDGIGNEMKTIEESQGGKKKRKRQRQRNKSRED